MGLGACTTERVRIVAPPAELQSCADEPAAPDIPARDGTAETDLRRDRMTLDYVLAMRSAWGDCFAKVAGVKAWSERVAQPER